MDAAFEKEIAVTRLKAAALHNRARQVLSLTELLGEFIQLTAILQKQNDALQAKLKAYEEKTVEPDGGAVRGAPPTPAG